MAAKNPLIPYNAARRAIATVRRALANAKSVDQVKDIRSKADLIRAYAKQARDKTLEVEAAEIRLRAERRLGQMIASQRVTTGLAKGAAQKGVGRRGKRGSRLDPQLAKVTLAEAGIDKHLAHRARRLAPSEELFEESIVAWRAGMERSHERVTLELLRATKPKQQSMFRDTPLSSSGRKLERVLVEEKLLPPVLRLNESLSDIIETLARGIRRLEKLTARINEPRAANKFQKVFGEMERKVSKLVEQFRAISKTVYDRRTEDAA